jgi:hypothetical protein
MTSISFNTFNMPCLFFFFYMFYQISSIQIASNQKNSAYVAEMPTDAGLFGRESIGVDGVDVGKA